jgi:hypothetical protein
MFNFIDRVITATRLTSTQLNWIAILTMWLSIGILFIQSRLMKRELITLRKSIIPISMAFRNVLIEELTHDYANEMDALLRKVTEENGRLSNEELNRFDELLEERRQQIGLTKSEYDATTMIRPAMRRVDDERDKQTNANFKKDQRK